MGLEQGRFYILGRSGHILACANLDIDIGQVFVSN
jgi:hypothetical protein